ncbi:hypothetical protein LSTR_LSTR001191 [Laodelphax striatellus]|uniref:Uncharacterized protein n=1 Tax=Laodelphax striatellus TaxID=195883 RepID=A0A482X2Q8_LAOST|nr:hypothetical protein LSTR_LSTR001191 [Laodelphax striatellus]
MILERFRLSLTEHKLKIMAFVSCFTFQGYNTLLKPGIHKVVFPNWTGFTCTLLRTNYRSVRPIRHRCRIRTKATVWSCCSGQ